MGFTEPHRTYEEGSGLKAGKRLEDVTVPGYFPDNDVVRGDLLDYAVEVEWADQHIVESARPAGESRRTGQDPGHRHLRPRHALPARKGPDLRGWFSPADGHAVGKGREARPHGR